MSEEQEPESKIMENGVIYLGEDQGYWESLKLGFSSYNQLKFEFELRYENDSKKIQNFLKLIWDFKPKLIFFDLSKNTHEMLHTMRALLRTNFNIRPFIIALVDYKQRGNVIQQAVMAGASCVHIKSGEVDSVIYDSILFAFPSAIEDHGFAKAQLDDKSSIFIPAKASVISASGMRIESNFKITKDEKYLLHSFWSKNKILKSPLAKARNQETEDLFYNYEFAQEFSFQYVSPIEVSDDMQEEEVEQLKMEKQHELQEAKSLMKEWINSNKDRSKPKLIKCTVIDKEMNFYIDQPLTDQYPFVIRAQPFLKKVKKELIKLAPHIIVFNFENIDEKDRESSEDIAYMFNDNKNLQYLIKVIKSIDDFDPFVIVFNSEHDTKKLQKVLNYSQIIAHKENLSTDLVIKMAGILEKKLFGDEEVFADNVVILDKSNEATYVEVELPIHIKSCSETDIYFDCDHEFEPKTILRLDYPAPMYVTIAETPKFAKTSAKYYGIVNGIGEDQLKDYRRFIHSVFFREKQAKRDEEANQAELKKQEFLKKKEEEEKAKAAQKEKDENNQDENQRKQAKG